jgi:hypothetical protein
MVSPLLTARTVLTNSPWNFVSLWLRREKKNKAQFFWNQAEVFHTAATGIPLQSAPLLHYYAFMNATKALLVAKGITFRERHGVHGLARGAGTRLSITSERVEIENHGILPALSAYLGETESVRIHSLQDLFFNLPYIHRTYCLTYRNQTDMYVPLTDCAYVLDGDTSHAYFQANLSRDFQSARVVRRLAPTFVIDATRANAGAIRSALSVPLTNPRKLTAGDLSQIATLHRRVRQGLHYINGSQTLWYAKSFVAGPRRLSRFSLTMTLAAMHRLSEICRYRPIELASLFAGQKNWLLSEFIELAPTQFLDEIAAEVTGYQFLTPNTRPAT